MYTIAGLYVCQYVFLDTLFIETDERLEKLWCIHLLYKSYTGGEILQFEGRKNIWKANSKVGLNPTNAYLYKHMIPPQHSTAQHTIPPQLATHHWWMWLHRNGSVSAHKDTLVTVESKQTYPSKYTLTLWDTWASSSHIRRHTHTHSHMTTSAMVWQQHTSQYLK